MKLINKKSTLIIIFSFCLLFISVNFNPKRIEEISEGITKEIQLKNTYLNPDYIEFIRECEKGDCSHWGAIPEKYLTEYRSEKYNVLDEAYALNKYGILENSEVGTYYNLLEISCGVDENGKNIPCSGRVKDQGTEGLCWAFATVSSLETNLLLNDKNEIFSEKQLDYASANPDEAFIEDVNPYSRYTKRKLNAGGNFLYSEYLFKEGISPVLESKFLEMAIEDDSSLAGLDTMPTSYDKPLSFKNVINFNNLDYYVSEYFSAPSLSYGVDETVRLEYINKIKELIKNNGSLYVGTAPPDSRAGTCYDSNTDTVIRRGNNNCGSGRDTGHAMSIIGWDDEHEYYNEGTGKTEKGAFILKNSWGDGTDPGDDFDLNTRGNYTSRTDAYSYLAYNSRFDTVYGVKTVEEKDWDNLYHSSVSKKEVLDESYTEIYSFSKTNTDEIIKSIAISGTEDITYNIFINTSNVEENYVNLGTITPEYSGLYKINIEDGMILSNDFSIKITKNTKYSSPTIIIYTSNIDKETKVISSNMDETIYLTNENAYSFTTNVSNIETGLLSYSILNESGIDISDEFILNDSYIVNNQSTATLSLADINNYKDYIGKKYKLITKYIYEEDGEQKEIINEKEFSIEVSKIENITLSTDNITVYKGYDKKIYVDITPSNVLEQTLEYKIDDNSIAEITDDGFIIGKSKGATSIVVSTTDGSNISKTISLNVEEELKDITSLSEITDKYGGYILLNDVVIDKTITTFEGTLDGNGHKFIIQNSSTFNKVFDKINNAYITNLVIASEETVEYSSAYYGYYGTLARMANYSIIEKIINTSNIEVSYSQKGAGDTGGIIGMMDYSILRKAYNIGTIKSTGSVAGLVGKTNNSVIEDVFNIGSVETQANTAYSIYNTIAAGIVSEGKNVKLKNSYSIGNISAPNKKSGETIYTASIIGEATNGSVVENTYSLDYMPSIIAETDSEKPTMINVRKYIFEEMKQQETYIGFNFDDIWEYNTIYPLPILKKLALILPPNNNKDFESGSGDIWNPYQISKPEHLNNIRDFNSSSFVLINDIDITYDTHNENGQFYNDGLGWEPIENFSGIFDGNNKKIIGLNINYFKKTDKAYNIGLFANTSNATIKNLGLEKAEITGPTDSSFTNYVGGIAGKMEDTSIDSCFIDGKVSSDSSNDNVAGFTGIAYYSEINNSFNIASIISKYSAAGLIGHMHIKNTIENSYNAGNIIGKTFVAGLVGFNQLSGKINNSYNVGKIIINNSLGGGLFGHTASNEIEISNVYNLEGIVFKKGTLVEGEYDKTTSEMKNTSTYEGFDFENTWEFNGVYPSLKSVPFKYITDLEVDNELITNIGSSNKINYSILPTDASKPELEYKANDSDILSIDESGNLIGLKAGNTTLTLSTTDGTYISKDINVTVLNKSINISNIFHEPDNIYDYLGGIVYADVKFTEFEDTTITYDIVKKDNESTTNLSEHFDIVMGEVTTTDDIKTATITINIPGNNENISAGIYELRILGEDNTISNTVTFEIKGYKHIDSITLDKTSLELNLGNPENKIAELTVTITPSDAINQKVIWTSSDENVATVDQSGKVTGVSRGTATITVTSEDGGKTDTCEVKVLEPKITIGKKTTNSNYDGILYARYGGTAIIQITTQDIEENSKLALKYYKDNIEMTNAEVIEAFKIGGNVVRDNKVNLQIGVTTSALKGKYEVEISYVHAETQTISFEVFAPKLVDGIEASDITLGVNENQKVNYTITNEDALNNDVEFSIRNKDESLTTLVATVDEEGNVTGKYVGEAILTITSKDGSATKEINIKVIERKISLSEIELNPNSLYDFIGGRINLTATLENIETDKVTVDVYKEGSESIITKDFTVKDNIANIEIDIPKGTTKGTYTIKVTAGDYSAEETFVVTEYIHVNSIDLNKDSIELLKGKIDDSLKVTINEDAINKKVTWSSTNENVATVDQNGKVTGVSRGTATITVTSEDGEKTDTCEVTVKEPKLLLGEKSINSNYDSILYTGYGGTVIVQITAQDIEETSKLTLKYYKDNIELTNAEVSNIFEVSGNVVNNNKVDLQVEVKPRALKGKYKIEVSAEKVETKYIEFEVYPPILVNGIEANDITLAINQSKKVNYKITNENALNQNVTFSIRNKDESLTTLVATVDEEGNVTGKHVGEAILTISSLDGGATKEINVTVFEKKITLTKPTITPNPLYDYIGGRINLTATLENIETDKVNVKVYKDSSNLLITKDFSVTDNTSSIELNIPAGTAEGLYTIKVTAGDYSNEETFEVTEYIYVSSIELNKDSLELLKGNSDDTLEVTINPTEAINKKVTWTSSDESVATVDENGKVTAVGRGTATITVTSEDGEKTDTCEVTVKEPKLILGEIKIDSNYNNLLYKDYGGTITVPITRQDIGENEFPNLIYYKKVGEEYQQITDVDTYNKIHNSNTIIENNNSTLKFVISSELEVGEYKVKMSYANSNTIMFTFEVFEAILVNDIEISDIKIPLDGKPYKIDYKVLPNEALNKEVEIITETNQNKIELLGEYITGLELGQTTLTIKSLDGSKIEKTINVEVVEKSINLTETEIIPSHIYNSNYNDKLYDVDGGTIKTKLTLSNINEIGLQYSLIKSDHNNQTNIINKINLTKDTLSGKLVLNINPNSLEAGNYKFKVIGENVYESNEIIFTINEYKKVENVDVKYNNESFDTLNVFVGRENVELNGIINETATNRQVEWVLDNENCSISDNNSRSIFLNAEKVGVCQLIFKSKEKHNSEATLEKTVTINVIDGNSEVIESIHQSNISNEFVDVKYGGTIINTIEFTNLKENNNLEVQVFDGNNLLDMEYVETDVSLLNNLLGTITLNIKPNIFNYPNKYTASKELTVKYTYTLNDIDNTKVTKEYKVTLNEYNPITTINLSETNLTLDINESKDIKSLITLEPNTATNKNVKYETNDSNILKIEGSTITGISEGTAKITIISLDNENIKNTINVKVERSKYLEFGNKINIYNNNGSKYLKFSNENNTYKELKNNINTNLFITLKDTNGVDILDTSSILKTGMKLNIGENKYDIVIKGDINGDGKVSITDLSQMRYHLAKVTGKEKTGAYELAADMNNSNTVSITDLSQMRKKLAGGN